LSEFSSILVAINRLAALSSTTSTLKPDSHSVSVASTAAIGSADGAAISNQNVEPSLAGVKLPAGAETKATN
jgi:hypothetical protein